MKDKIHLDYHCLGIVFFFSKYQCTRKIAVDKAIETALQNNLNVKSQKPNSDYLQKMTKTGYDIPNRPQSKLRKTI